MVSKFIVFFLFGVFASAASAPYQDTAEVDQQQTGANLALSFQPWPGVILPGTPGPQMNIPNVFPVNAPLAGLSYVPFASRISVPWAFPNLHQTGSAIISAAGIGGLPAENAIKSKAVLQVTPKVFPMEAKEAVNRAQHAAEQAHQAALSLLSKVKVYSAVAEGRRALENATISAAEVAKHTVLQSSPGIITKAVGCGAGNSPKTTDHQSNLSCGEVQSAVDTAYQVARQAVAAANQAAKYAQTIHLVAPSSPLATLAQKAADQALEAANQAQAAADQAAEAARNADESTYQAHPAAGTAGPFVNYAKLAAEQDTQSSNGSSTTIVSPVS